VTVKEERPWGWFEILYEESNLKIKRIMVKPGRRLSLQSHQNRAENWVVIQGNALVSLEDREIPLSTSQAVFIPRQARHRMANPGKNDLIFVEVQTGTYLGEDDIVRFEDDFDRC